MRTSRTAVGRGAAAQTALAEAKVAGEGLTGEKHAWGVARAELQSKLDRATADIERLTKVCADSAGSVAHALPVVSHMPVSAHPTHAGA